MPSLLEAIEMKYGVIEHQIRGESFIEADADISIFVPKKSPRVCIPSLLVLNDFDIETAGDGSEIEHKCAGVEELDLAMNKLEEWSEIIAIFEHMPRLKFANLSFNTLSSPLNKNIGQQWSQLRSLVLNSTHIDWRSVRQLIQLLPELQELHLSFNDYNHVDLEDDINTEKCDSCAQLQDNNTSIKVNKCEKVSDSRKNLTDDEKSDESSTRQKDHDPQSSTKCDDYENKNDALRLKVANSQFQTHCQCPVYNKSENGELKKRVIHTNIKKLQFTGNPIKKWSEICKLGKSFPNLESLVLADCPIESLDIGCEVSSTAVEDSNTNKKCRSYDRTESACEADEIETPHCHFRNLLFLNLNCTAIADWCEIERVAKFQKLQCLRIQGCPLWESHENTQHERRQLMIARLRNISMLNGGGAITDEERESSERAFIRYFMDKPEDQRPERYSELIAIHGELEPLADVDMCPEKRVKVTFTFKDRSEVRSVDVYRTVADLKTKLEPITGLSAARMRLFYVDQDLRHIQGPEEMKYASKQLYSYNIRSGDEIIVDQKKRTHSSTST